MAESIIRNEEIRDCRWCEHGCTDSPEGWVACFLDMEWQDIDNPIQEAEGCQFFEYCDVFPKS